MRYFILGLAHYGHSIKSQPAQRVFYSYILNSAESQSRDLQDRTLSIRIQGHSNDPPLMLKSVTIQR